jgi:hypothetical protein
LYIYFVPFSSDSISSAALNAAQCQGGSSMHRAKRPLSRHLAMHFNPNFKYYASVKDKFDIEGILIKLHAMYPELGFLRYEKKLQESNIYHLEAANILEIDFYKSYHVGMTEKAAGLFRQHVSMEYTKALLGHERGKMRERRIANGNSDDDNNLVPVHYYHS